MLSGLRSIELARDGEQETKIREIRMRFEALSPREQKVMTLVAAGLMNKQVAAQINISEVTVKFHRHNVMNWCKVFRRFGENCR